MKKLFILIIIIISAVILLAVRIRMKYSSAKSSSDFILSVYSHEVSGSDITISKSFTGPVNSTLQAELSSQITQRIKSILKNEGDTVNTDETIALLEDTEMKLRLDQSIQRKNAMDSQIESLQKKQEFLFYNLEFLSKELERSSILLEKGAVSRQSHDTIQNSYQKAKTDFESFSSDLQRASFERDTLITHIKETRLLLGYTELKSPARGVIRKVLMKEGELASPGRPVFIIDSTMLFKIAFDMPREDAGLVKPGQPVLLDTVPQLKASVSKIYPSLRNNIFTAEVLLESLPDEYPLGSSINIDVIIEQKESALTVPNNAILETEGRYYVFRIIDHTLSMKEVKPGIAGKDRTEILTGLKPGDKVATGGFLTVRKYRDGQLVHIAGEL